LLFRVGASVVLLSTSIVIRHERDGCMQRTSGKGVVTPAR
jgi:hypothetical protein